MPKAMGTTTDPCALGIHSGRLRAACFVLGLLSACGGATENSALEDYPRRIAAVLGKPVPQLQPAALPRWPAPASLPPAPEALRLSSADTLLLLSCGMTQLLAQRNSTLAKVQDAGQTLHLDQQLLQALQGCRDQTTDTTEQERLQDLVEAKSRQYQAQIVQAGAGSREFAQFLSYSEQGRGPMLAGVQALEGLAEAVQQAREDEAPMGSDWARLQQGLSETRAGGRLLRQQQALHQAFASANTLLRPWAEPGALCRPNYRPQKAVRLESVFRQLFLLEVQALWAEHQRLMSRSRVALALLLDAQAGPAAQAYFQQAWAEGNPGQRALAAAASEHVRLWQAILEACGSRPTPPP